MKNRQYDSRAEQIEREDFRDIIMALKADGITPSRRLRKVIRHALKGAATVAAFEERSHCFDVIDSMEDFKERTRLKNSICNVPTLQLLGYEKGCDQ